MKNKLKLHGFNNLTKSLSFNIYDVCYAKTSKEQLSYIDYIDEEYNSERITNICQTARPLWGRAYAAVIEISWSTPSS